MTSICSKTLRKLASMSKEAKRDWLDNLAGEWNTPLGFLPALVRADRDPGYLYSPIPPRGSEAGKAQYQTADDYRKYAEMRMRSPKYGESPEQTAARVNKEVNQLYRTMTDRQLDRMSRRIGSEKNYEDFLKNFGGLKSQLTDIYRRTLKPIKWVTAK